MIKTLSFFILIFVFSIEAKDYLFETGGIISNVDEEIIIYPDGSKFIVYKGNNGAWKDSEGDYGKEKCIGYVETNKEKNADVHFRCEGANQHGEKFWTTRINGTGKYKKMIGLKCPYGVQYHEDAVWYTHKCKIN